MDGLVEAAIQKQTLPQEGSIGTRRTQTQCLVQPLWLLAGKVISSL